MFDFLLQCTFTLTLTGNLIDAAYGLDTVWNLDTTSVCLKGLKILCNIQDVSAGCLWILIPLLSPGFKYLFTVLKSILLQFSFLNNIPKTSETKYQAFNYHLPFFLFSLLGAP